MSSLQIAPDGRGFLTCVGFGTGGTYCTSDFGRDWRPSQTGMPGRPYLFAMDIDGFGLAAGNGLLALTRDAGDTWTRIEHGEEIAAVATHADGTALVCTRHGAALLTRDHGTTWESLSIACGGTVEQLCFAAPRECFALVKIFPDPTIPEEEIRSKAYWLSQFDSRSAATPEENWLEAQRECSHLWQVWSSMSPHTGWSKALEARSSWSTLDSCGEMAAIATDQAVFTRKHAGADWTETPSPQTGVLHLVTAEKWIIQSEEYVTTADAGSTWERRYPPSGNNSKVRCVTNHERVFALGGNYAATFTVNESMDAGATWETIHVYNHGHWRHEPS
ncbi:MAG: WD40/YVTN/BNR-like repeat-containing protein [Roseimicrobium sp.]